MIPVTVLPTINAVLNGTSGLLLILGYLLIRQRKITAHKLCMGSALGTSTLFLISYLAYHYQVGSISFTGHGGIRALYFTILISHTVLAAVIPLLALMTVSRALRGRFDRHVRIARFTLPLWLYVSVTGVLIYFMLYHLYPPA
ncbi:DUF420 domain-containing protein [Candidatus Methylomirabilis sp.]|uniref:DUF420 domain-containing protein n=1 Tax=Candidatus Methylomirabilis sp. TaxID=2032687 RepID=UPI003C770774